MRSISLLILSITLFSNLYCKKSKNDDFNDLLLLYLFSTRANATACGITSDDPLYTNQWHLNNVGQSGGTTGEDARVLSVWNESVFGSGVNVAVVDDGLEESHEDLKANISTSIPGINLVNDTSSPTHIFSNSYHGSAVAGVIGARASNSLGGRGAAPCVNLVGVDILEQNTIPSSDEFSAMTHNVSAIAISNNSWGAPDNYGTYSASSSLWRSGIDTGVSSGRQGKGTLYFWAAGNGGNPAFPTTNIKFDNSNYDGQANYYGVMAIGGIGQNGKRAAYSESGANVLAVTHTQGNDTTTYTTAITTVDATGNRGSNNSTKTSDLSDRNYTKFFNGTSSAAPLAAGIAALLISKYPDLSWRDVRELIAYSARKNDASDSDWRQNAAGLNINHQYGFGAIDGEALLNRAKNWNRIVTNQSVVTGNADTTSRAIPDNNATGVSFTYTFSSSLTYTEFVAVEFGTGHTYYPELDIEITSPNGTVSKLAESHRCYRVLYSTTCSSGSTTIASSTGSSIYRFGLVRTLGENPNGNWSVKVADTSAADTGSVNYIRLTVYGR
ncbi:convertase P-domain protein [Leptospira ryugenii]|uniref:Convertase P-domain protein n=1 Tax=Leptospira ryugenii TaxID=1917863 RepID=A0A2P2E3Q1_9LEPT|nr:S8 family serine peptidase [Leptospira ryugenii]GBF51497.1 convertase P-domain protein [Leptospira ryugenii]